MSIRTPPPIAMQPEPHDPTHTPAEDPPAIHSRLARHPRLHKLAIRFVEQWPQRYAELRAAADGHDLAELARLAHALKGVGGSVGFDAVFEPARALDVAAKAGDERLALGLLDRLGELGRRLKAPTPMPAVTPACSSEGATS